MLIFSYGVLLPVLATSLVGIAWLMRGRTNAWTQFHRQAANFEIVDGLVATHLAIASMIVVVALIARRLHDRNLATVSSVKPGLRWGYLLACVVVSGVLLNALLWLTRAPDASAFRLDSHTFVWLVLIGLTAPLQAAAEEYVFRGYLLQAAVAIGLNKWLAVVVLALFFALLHGPQDLPLLADRFCFGLLAGAAVLLIGGLEGPIAVHAANNVFAFGYAAISGGVAQARQLQVSSWHTTLANSLGYLLSFAAIYLLARALKLSNRSPLGQFDSHLPGEASVV